MRGRARRGAPARARCVDTTGRLLPEFSMTGSEHLQRHIRVVHAHLLAGAEWRLHDPQRRLTHDRLLYIIQRPFGRITSMPATGHFQTGSASAEVSSKRSSALVVLPCEARAT